MHQFTIIGTLRVRMVIFNHRLRTHTHTHVLFSVVSRPPEVPSGPSNLGQDTPRDMRATYMHWHSATRRLTHRHTLTHTPVRSPSTPSVGSEFEESIYAIEFPPESGGSECCSGQVHIGCRVWHSIALAHRETCTRIWFHSPSVPALCFALPLVRCAVLLPCVRIAWRPLISIDCQFAEREDGRVVARHWSRSRTNQIHC